MNEVKVLLSDNVARAILLDVAKKVGSYNQAWSWWAYEAREQFSYPFGFGVARVVQRTVGDFNATGDTEMIFELHWDAEETPHFYRIRGEYSSYGGDEWDSLTFKEVRPTEKVIRLYE